MSNGLDMAPGAFRAPRIPLDLRCILLATAGFLVASLVDGALAELWDVRSPTAQLLELLGRQVDRIAFLADGFARAFGPIWGFARPDVFERPAPYELEWWQALVAGLLFFGVWGIFGGALLRTSVLRLTRDEPVSLGDATRFGIRNTKDFLLVPVLVAGFATAFALLNALAGVVMSVWFVGSSLLALILFPLALLSSLLVVLSLIGGVVGLPLMWAGIATEQKGSIEAVSRAFSYISARPFRFLFGYLLVFVLMSAVMLAGSYFETTAKDTLQAGVWRGEFDEVIAKDPPKVSQLQDAYENHESVEQRREGVKNIRNIRHAKSWDKLGFLGMWFFLNLFLLGFKGYALYAFLGGSASIYLQLRREVDGTDEDEIFVAGEDGDAAAARARWVDEPPPPPQDAGEGAEKDTGDGTAGEDKEPPDAG